MTHTLESQKQDANPCLQVPSPKSMNNPNLPIQGHTQTHKYRAADQVAEFEWERAVTCYVYVFQFRIPVVFMVSDGNILFDMFMLSGLCHFDFLCST